MIKVSGLTKDYGARRAINNLNFDAQQGEIVGFLGPNGAGKTTFARDFLPAEAQTLKFINADLIAAGRD